MSVLFPNRPLSPHEKANLPEGEQKVVAHYERTTKRSFMRYELLPLKQCIRAATPEAINHLVSRFYSLYPLNFTDFSYMVRPVSQMLKRSRGGAKRDPSAP